MGYRIKLGVLIITFVINAADMISDWLLYHDVAHAEQGLVFGPFDKILVNTLLAFCFLGSAIFVTEIIILALDLHRKDMAVAVDIMTLIATVCEEIPQLAINVAIVVCREEAISVFQVSKASICIISALFRFTLTIISYYCLKRKDDGTDKQIHGSVKTKCLTIPGLTIVVALSAVVFSFANFSYDDGTLQFNHPRNLFEGEYHNKDKYLGDVGLFANFQTNNVQNGNSPLEMMNNDQWMKLAKVGDIGPKDSAIVVKLNYAVLSDRSQVLQIQSSTAGEFTSLTNLASECYQRKPDGQLYFISQQNCTMILQNVSLMSAIFKFDYIETDDHLIMGDIHYNYRKLVNGSCDGTAAKGDNPLSKIKYNLRYMKLQSNTDKKHHLVFNKDNTGAQFFSVANGNVIDVKDVWKTGVFKCESTGRHYPKLVTEGINVPCL